MAIVFSPHLDDAVLSLGQYLQTASPTVVTVFAGFPPAVALTDYDEARGYTSSRNAVEERRLEDGAALSLLGCTADHLGFLDHQYGGVPDEVLALTIDALLEPDVLVPLGIGHPDHRQLARCVRNVARVGMPLFFYEELPYRVLWPEEAHRARAQLMFEGFAVQEVPFPLAQGDREAKAKAIGCYRSQFPNGADDPCLLVPERVWRAVKCA